MRVKRTHVGGKIVVKKNPPFAGFRARDFAHAGLGKDRGGVHLQKIRGLFNAHRSDV
jgi:hypothetical protein